MDYKHKKIAVLSPVAWRTPPREYGAWETVASNITEGLVAKGWDVTLFATADSATKANLKSIVATGYELDKTQIPKVSECLHTAFTIEHARHFDLIHNNFDYLPLTYSRLIKTPMLTTIHGFSSPDILRVYRNYKDTYYVSISDSDRDPELPYLATVYNGIDLSNITFSSTRGRSLTFLGRIHPDKGTHLAIQVAKKSQLPLIIAGIIQDQNYFDSQIKPYIDDINVKFIGPVDPPKRDKLFKESYAVIHLNTIPERFGLVMAEAMAAGVPVIASDLGSCREVIKHKTTGFLVDNVDQAVTAVKNIPQIAPAACRQRVEQNFSMEKMVENYEKVYTHIFEMEARKCQIRS